MGHNSSGCYQSPVTNCHWKDCRVGADTRSATQYSTRQLPRGGSAARCEVIHKRGVRTNKDIILNCNPIPELHTAFDRYTIPDHHIVLDEDMGADVTIGSDPSLCKHHAKLPDTRSLADGRGLDIGAGMDIRGNHDCYFVSVQIRERHPIITVQGAEEELHGG